MALIEIPATTGTGFTLRTGHRLRVVDLQGSQVCDLMAFRLGADHDPLSNGRTFDYGRKIHLSTPRAMARPIAVTARYRQLRPPRLDHRS